MDNTTAIILGAALVAVGVLAFKAMQPPAPPAASSAGGSPNWMGLLGSALGSKQANDLGASLLSKISTTFGGSSSW